MNPTDYPSATNGGLLLLVIVGVLIALGLAVYHAGRAGVAAAKLLDGEDES